MPFKALICDLFGRWGQFWFTIFFGRFWRFLHFFYRADFTTNSATLYTCPKSRNFTCHKLKIWYFEDFLVLNLIVTFILLRKLSKTAKNAFKPAKMSFQAKSVVLAGLIAFLAVLALLARQMNVIFGFSMKKSSKSQIFSRGQKSCCDFNLYE